MLEWNLISVLTGATVAFLATFIYSTLTNAFLCGGKFRRKEEAIFIYLTTSIVLGFFTPAISYGWLQLIQMLTPLKIVGLLIIVGNAVVNQCVKRWKHTTPKTVLLYMIGFILLLMG